MNRSTLFLLALLIGLAPVGPARATTDWHAGLLVLADGTQLEGPLNYNWKAEIVQLRQANTTKAYSAFQIESFTFYDQAQSQQRTFVSLNFPVKPGLSRRLLLEECAKGPLTVYRRLRHAREPIKIGVPSAYGSDRELSRDTGSFSYYVVAATDHSTPDEPARFLSVDKFYRDIWPLMLQKQGDNLKHLLSKGQLSMNDTEVQLMLIGRYNTLEAEQHLSAEQIGYRLIGGGTE
jgi:hypothetical protein